MSTAATGGVVTLILAALALLIAILWILMPFAIFGTKDLLKQLLREQRKTNDLLQAQAGRAPAVEPVVEPLERSGPPLSRIHPD